MVKRETMHCRTDELIEGPACTSEPVDPRARFESDPPPSSHLSARSGPAGETGLLPVIQIAEGDDLGETQDASRTTAENRAVPLAEVDAMPHTAQPAVLIVEDTVDLARLIQITLNRINITSVIETSGSTALQRYFELQPTVVLLDLGLPDMTGWKVLDGIREFARHAESMPAVIVITAYGDAANRLVGKLQNVHGYLVKPFTADDITRAVRQALNTRVQ